MPELVVYILLMLMYAVQEARGRPTNVLLILVDDLNPNLDAAYGRYQAKTPALDEFALDSSTMVAEAYTSYPLCGPSRLSTLTGKYPLTLNNMKQGQAINFKATNSTPMGEFFRNLGYFTLKGGKVYQPGQVGADVFHKDVFPKFANYLGARANGCGPKKRNSRSMQVGSEILSYEAGCYSLDPLSKFPDYILAKKVAAELKKLKNRSNGFFFVVGFTKPHLPFYVQQRFWQAINITAIDDLEDTQNGGPVPKELYSLFFTADPDMPLYHLGANANPWGQKPSPDFIKLVRAAYLAAVAQTDFCFSIILTALKQTGLDQNTIVVLASDHGFNLGQNGKWGKETLDDGALRIPMLFRVPGLNPAPFSNIKRSKTAFFMNLVDLYPTLASLAGLKDSLPDNLDGKDKSTLITNVIQGIHSAASDSDRMVFSFLARCSKANCESDRSMDSVTHVGISLKTPDYRYTAFFDFVDGQIDFDAVHQAELYEARRTDQETILNYEEGATFGTNHYNIAPDHPEICRDMLGKIRDRFERK